MLSYESAIRVVVSVIEALNSQHVTVDPLPTDESALLIGVGSALDSLGLVSLLVETEERAAAAGCPDLGLLEQAESLVSERSVSVRQFAELVQTRANR
jgi:hypothetical protein